MFEAWLLHSQEALGLSGCEVLRSRFLSEAAGSSRGLPFKEMTLASALMLDATFSGDLEGLLRTTVRLHLWHLYNLSSLLVFTQRLASVLLSCPSLDNCFVCNKKNKKKGLTSFHSSSRVLRPSSCFALRALARTRQIRSLARPRQGAAAT